MFTLYFDGCCKGNPGPGGAGAVIYQDDQEIATTMMSLGKVTNNEAEYQGLINGLKLALKKEITILDVKGDSVLVIKQMKKEYKVAAPNLIPMYKEATELANAFESISFSHVFRNENKRADKLANESLDGI